MLFLSDPCNALVPEAARYVGLMTCMWQSRHSNSHSCTNIYSNQHHHITQEPSWQIWRNSRFSANRITLSQSPLSPSSSRMSEPLRLVANFITAIRYHTDNNIASILAKVVIDNIRQVAQTHHARRHGSFGGLHALRHDDHRTRRL